MFSDKTMHNVQLSKAITYYLRFIDELYHVIEDSFDMEKKEDKEKFEKVRLKYKKISEEHGAEIKGVYYISRDEPFPSFYENADFSLNTIKTSIRDGELKTNKVLKEAIMSSEKP
jgi:NTE family protein